MIKKIIAYLPCHIFYYLGDKVSVLLNLIPEDDKFQSLGFFGYQLYNGLMLWSVWWNDIGDLSVWSKGLSKTQD